MNRTTTSSLIAGLVLSCLAATAIAKNVDLVTLPKRDTVQLTIYNSEDLTLAKEIRSLTLKKGKNQLQFSWAGTLIDHTSIELRPLQHADQIEVVDTVLSGQKKDSLIWNIESEFEGQALVEVSYFTSGLTWRMDYVAVCNPAETQMRFEGHVRVFNNSGENYENAEVRLIVGKINLVERIADLAKRQGLDLSGKDKDRVSGLKWNTARNAIMLGAKLERDEEDSPADDAKKIVKDGVSEYFMFSVKGRESVNNGWSKRMPAIRADDASFDIIYRLRSYQYGLRPVRFFVWKNDEEHQLGDSPLPDGIVRVFRENGRQGLSYLGQQQLRYVPIQADIEVNLGVDDLLVVRQTKNGTRRENFQFDRFQRKVTGWDELQQWIGTIRNYRSKPIQIEIRLQFNGDVELKSTGQSSSFDYRTVEFKRTADAGGEAEFPYSMTIHQGANAKQNRVRLRAAP